MGKIKIFTEKVSVNLGFGERMMGGIVILTCWGRRFDGEFKWEVVE
jgi:hypothetical protein